VKNVIIEVTGMDRMKSALSWGLALAVTFSLGSGRGSVSAQELNPCGLLTNDDIHAVAAETNVAAGVANTVPSQGYAACRYDWGTGIYRFKLDVVVTDPSRVYKGISPEQVKQQLLQLVREGTYDAVITEVGDTAVFTPDSPVYGRAIALVKGRILEVRLDGLFAGEKKDQIVGLLKSAASRM
jgi:hypothetical protein